MKEVLAHWGISSSASTLPISDGLINGSWKVTSEDQVWLLQRINHEVFLSPQDLMTNHQLISEHIDSRSFPLKYPKWLTSDTEEMLVDYENQSWRMGIFYNDTHTFQKAEHVDAAWKVGNAFGAFDAALMDLSPNALTDTITAFHNLDRYLDKLRSTIPLADPKRINIAKPLIDKVDEYISIGRLDFEKNRVIHNDAKISNLLFKDEEVYAIIDWDTTMSGHISWEYADLLRSTGVNVAEDHAEISDMELKYDLMEGMTAGFKSQIYDHINEEERSSLYHGAIYLIFEQAIRFLEDYLAGDLYYQCDYDDHNYVRAQNQFHLLDLLHLDKKKVKACILGA